ncbi:MAG: LEA type 2 family protein [Bacteroidales bacterium]|nr:LEA type 2 family protein [Bacteroidales bacterium]
MKTRILMSMLALLMLVAAMSSCAIQEVNVGTPKDVKVQNLSLSGISISGKIPIDNPNSFGFNVKGVKLDVSVNGIPVGCINKKEKIHINPKSNNAYSLNYDASFKDIVKDPVALKNALTKGSVSVKLSGYVKVSKFIVSKKIKVEHQENINKFKFF